MPRKSHQNVCERQDPSMDSAVSTEAKKQSQNFTESSKISAKSESQRGRGKRWVAILNVEINKLIPKVLSEDLPLATGVCCTAKAYSDFQSRPLRTSTRIVRAKDCWCSSMGEQQLDSRSEFQFPSLQVVLRTCNALPRCSGNRGWSSDWSVSIKDSLDMWSLMSPRQTSGQIFGGGGRWLSGSRHARVSGERWHRDLQIHGQESPVLLPFHNSYRRFWYPAEACQGPRRRAWLGSPRFRYPKIESSWTMTHSRGVENLPWTSEAELGTSFM